MITFIFEVIESERFVCVRIDAKHYEAAKEIVKSWYPDGIIVSHVYG